MNFHKTVSADCLTLEAKVLEPSCGTCNFLVDVLNRKLAHLDADRTLDIGGRPFYRQALLATATMYGLDISRTNIEESRAILADAFRSAMRKRRSRRQLPQGVETALATILKTNLIETDVSNPDPKERIIEYIPDGWVAFGRQSHSLADTLRGDNGWLALGSRVCEKPPVPYWELA